jgi:hypothetical protein
MAHASTPSHPARDLLSKYKAVLQAAWQHRAELAGPARLADEAAFLPAALSLQDTPVHPAPRRFAMGIMLLFVIALVWAIFGKVDIVRLIAKGVDDKSIANALSISEKTVRNHLTDVYHQLGVHKRAQLMALLR